MSYLACFLLLVAVQAIAGLPEHLAVPESEVNGPAQYRRQGVMADQDRIVYPYEVEDAKAAAASRRQNAEEAPNVVLRNQIVVPPNTPPPPTCAKNEKLDLAGICREVW